MDRFRVRLGMVFRGYIFEIARESSFLLDKL